jgi:hypothetical protein
MRIGDRQHHADQASGCRNHHQDCDGDPRSSTWSASPQRFDRPGVPSLPCCLQPCDLFGPPGGKGKAVIVGHTPQRSEEILYFGYLKCIDSYGYGGDWLTALEMIAGKLWQTNQR